MKGIKISLGIAWVSCMDKYQVLNNFSEDPKVSLGTSWVSCTDKHQVLNLLIPMA